MANNGCISILKVSLEAYGHYASNYHFRIFKNQKFIYIYIRRPQIKKCYKTDPPEKSGNSDEIQFQNFQKPKKTKKDPLKLKKCQKWIYKNLRS